MSDTNSYITIMCDADLTRRNALAGFVRETFTVFEAVRLYVAHRAQEKEKPPSRRPSDQLHHTP